MVMGASLGPRISMPSARGAAFKTLRAKSLALAASGADMMMAANLP